ncbi:dienelactone hydrolase family protein [Zavarzinia sp. CC-PAN008]|uniref:dienelactone hydrolase family protein n=1 Tax=Zavarzinia sp. CC-PAN008 TaxID=3243332 RepID=UPI003F744526
MRRIVGFFLAAWALACTPSFAATLAEDWPAADPARHPGQPVTFDSRSPFAPDDMGPQAPRTIAQGTLWWPPGASASAPVPAVIMLHGAAGVQDAREGTYGPQLAQQGFAALSIDAFGARRDRWSSFRGRLLEVTESMVMADAYAALHWLTQRPEIDRNRVVLMGFSYGAMATMYALNDGIARAFSATYGDGTLRFAAHVAYYGPCIVRFAEPRTTGAPLLMLMGGRDEITNPQRCAETADAFRAGGSAVESITYPEAAHQWDGARGLRRIGNDLSPCRLVVDDDLSVHDDTTGLPMIDGLTRRAILVLCVRGEGYLSGRDDAVRARSNRDLGRFLNRVLGGA